jgi:hypothetical protein
MTSAAWNERAVAPNNRFPEGFGLSGSAGINQGLFGNREKNLVNHWCAYVCACICRCIEVFEVGIGSDLKGLHSLVRVATFNRDKNLVSRIWTDLQWWWGCLGQIVKNISQASWIGLLRQGWVVRQKTHSRIFPNTPEVVFGVCNNVHGFSRVRGICVSAEPAHKPCVLR